MTRITIAKAHVIGTEILDAILSVISVIGSKIEIDEIILDAKNYLAGNAVFITKESWDIVKKTKCF